MHADFTFRRVEADDHPFLREWWEAHAGMEFPAAILPPLGVLVSDADGPAAALWCYEVYGVGVAFLEFPVSRPGLAVSVATAAFRAAVDACVKLAGQLIVPPGEFRVFRCMTLAPIARVLGRMGWTLEPTPRIAATLYIEADGN